MHTKPWNYHLVAFGSNAGHFEGLATSKDCRTQLLLSIKAVKAPMWSMPVPSARKNWLPAQFRLGNFFLLEIANRPKKVRPLSTILWIEQINVPRPTEGTSWLLPGSEDPNSNAGAEKGEYLVPLSMMPKVSRRTSSLHFTYESSMTLRY